MATNCTYYWAHLALTFLNRWVFSLHILQGRTRYSTICCQQGHCVIRIVSVALPSRHQTAVDLAMLIVWPLASWVAELKLWPTLPRCTPPACSVCLRALHSTHLLRQASQNVDSSKSSLSPTLSLILYFFPPPNFSIIALYRFHSACPSIKASSTPNSCALMSGRGERGVSVKKNLQLCFILHRTGCCTCRCLSASTDCLPQNPSSISYKYLSIACGSQYIYPKFNM